MYEINYTNVLVLGATGKVGSRVAQRLADQGITVRRASRTAADMHFDWNDPGTFAATLRGMTGVFLVAPVMRVDFAGVVARFLDQAVQSGVRNVTFLSAYGMEHAPADVALRVVERDLAARGSLTHTILRPAWFMQNFSETFLKPVNDEIIVPCGSGAEAFVSVDDIAAVAAATLSDPVRHAGRAYAPTGPAALSLDEVAACLSGAAGRKIAYRDIDRDAWINAMVAGGIPAEYGEVLRTLTAIVASGHGARPNQDVLDVTGTPPVSFGAFAAQAAAAWK